MNQEEKKATPEVRVEQDKASGRAITALILGIAGLVFCPPTAIVAWILGKIELNAIRRGESSSQGRGLALAGYILGIVGTIFIILGILGIILAIAIPSMLKTMPPVID